MRIGFGSTKDKEKVLLFCKKTFSWGDYISDVWDSWVTEGNLLVGYQNKEPVAICHGSIDKKNKQVWIEGIRVNSKFRRMGFASKLVKTVESICKKNNCINSYMLIDVKNTKSLALAKSLNYKNKETWYFLSLLPKPSKLKFSQVNFARSIPSNVISKSEMYVQSWRWYPLDRKILNLFIKNKKIIITKGTEEKFSWAVVSDSEHFDQTLMVTLYGNSSSDIKRLLKFIQNYSFQKGYQRIQILTPMKLIPKVSGLQKRLEFNLMKKIV